VVRHEFNLANDHFRPPGVTYPPVEAWSAVCVTCHLSVSSTYFLVPIHYDCVTLLTHYVAKAYFGVLVPSYIDGTWFGKFSGLVAVWSQGCRI
jgi:hypothetical protein